MVALVAALGGCTSIPPGRTTIDAVGVAGTSQIEESTVADKIATAPTEKFLGLFRGVVYDYSVYDPSLVQRDLARIERFYRGQGLLEAHARVARVSDISPGHVRVDFVVEEGRPTLNRTIRIEGIEGLPAPIVSAVQSAAQTALPVGKRFDEDAYKASQVAVLRALTDRGYAYATLTYNATIDLGAHVVDYDFTAVPGPIAKFGKISFIGLDPDGAGPRPQEIAEPPLRRAIAIDPGDLYSTEAIDDATQALLELEAFTSVNIEPQLVQPPPANPVVDLIVHTEPTKLRELRLGFGAEFDEIKTDVHLIASWEDHNFIGGLRDFTVTFQPGVVLYPLYLGNYVAPNKPLPEERLKMNLRQPSFFEARTNGILKGEFNVYPLLVVPRPAKDDPVIDYKELKGSAGVDRPFGKHLYASFTYNVQLEYPFDVVNHPEVEPPKLFIAYPELVTTLDLRDDPKHPHKGIYLSDNLQSAGGPFGGQAADIRVLPEFRSYIPLGKRITFATRIGLGFLFARNYAQSWPTELTQVFVPHTAAGDTYVDDIEKMYFRGLFSGGPNSNRGFPIRGVAPYGFVPFLNPANAAQQVALGCVPDSKGALPATCASPIGGFTMWELSSELRVKVSGPFSTAAFCDMSDVSPKQFDLRIAPLRPHLSCGLGLRYDTPVGPIRLDLGYRIEPLQVLGYKDDYAANKYFDSSEGIPQRLFGLPLAIAFGIGEAY